MSSLAGVGATSNASSFPHRFSHLLMATDLSARSDRALARAALLAKQHQADLDVLHVVDEDLPEKMHIPVVRAAEIEMSEAVARLIEGEGHAVGTHATVGKGADSILRTADQLKTDLIILGIHRNEAKDRSISGTTMERVLRYGQHPVLVVTKPANAAYQNIMIAVDFSAYSRVAVRYAAALAPGATLTFVHAFEVPFEGFIWGRAPRKQARAQHEAELSALVKEEMTALIDSTLGPDQKRPTTQMFVRHGDVHTVLRDVAAEITPDLLVMGTHGRVGIAHAVLGSVAEAFLSRPVCDTLAVKAW